MPSIEARNVTISFPLSFDRMLSVRKHVAMMVRGLVRKQKTTQSKRRFEALKDLTVSMRAGDVVGVIGPNGSGKTTLLRAIAGIYYPDTGTLETTGRVSTLLSLGTGFNNNLSGRENIQIAGLLMGLDELEIQDRTPEIIAYAELGDFIHVPMKFYSSGMISRLGFAIVASMDPDILLVDEVFAVGDLAFRQKSEKTIQDILAKTSCQVIVTHSLAFVRQHCNRALYFSGGQLLMDGPSEDVVAKYTEDVMAGSRHDTPAERLAEDQELPFSTDHDPKLKAS